jgi:hypothetical protein
VDVTEWEPATDAEVAMRDALRMDDQESYFRILAGIELLLPVSADALAGLAPLGWGTWSTGGRTHVLAFTSPSALQACLADYSGSARRIAYGELANTWPNLEWWLAVNPGLPIEGYLPAWFVAQLARGDLRLPARGPNRDAAAIEASGGADPQSTGSATAAAPAAAAATPAPAGAVPAAAPPAPAAAPPAPAAAPAGVMAGDPGLAARTTGGGLPMRTPGAAAADLSSRYVPATGPARPFGSPARPVDAAAQPAAPESAEPWSADSPSADAQQVGSQPFATEPVATESFGTEPLASQPVSAQPVSAQPVSAEPVSAEPVGSEPVGSEPVAGESADGPTPMRRPLPTRVPGPPEAHEQPTPGGPLPRRPMTPAAERPPTMAAAAQAIAGARLPQPAPQSAPDADYPPARPQPVPAAPAALAPPVIPGTSSGRDQLPSRTSGGFGGGVPAPAARPEIPPNSAAAAFRPRPDAPTRFGPPPADPPPQAPFSEARSSQAPRSQVPHQQDHPYGVQPAPVEPVPAEVQVDDFEEEFRPANEVEQDLWVAADSGSTDVFLSTLLLATVLVPVGEGSRQGALPGDEGFRFRAEHNDGDRYLVVFTSPDRLADHYPEPVRTVGVRFHHLINNWPDESWAFAVNPGSPVGAKLPGAQIVALASWATEAGLGADPVEREPVPAPVAPAPEPRPDTGGAVRQIIMQKTVPVDQVDFFLDRGYDRVSGFVHKADELAHLRTPADLYAALGLGYTGSPFQADAKETYVLRWAAYRPSLYRIPYGGQNDQAMQAMDGWVIERAPFRGNGFAPGEGNDVIAEFKVDSARLPHGAQLWRLDADGEQRMIAVFDGDAPAWRRVGEQ